MLRLLFVRLEKERIRGLFLFIVTFSLVFLTALAQAQGYRDLFNFPGPYVVPYTSAVITFDSAGNRYGTGFEAGTNQAGCFWELTTGGVYKDLHDFGNTVTYPDGTTGIDGVSPESNVVFDSSGNLYGTTETGGEQSKGTIWEYTKFGGYKILYSFGGQITYTNGTTGPDGYSPTGQVAIDSSGNLYGTTEYGGDLYGLVWELTPGGAYKDLADFTSQAFGIYPISGVTMDQSGNFYGTTYAGGAYGAGIAWELPVGGTVKTLHAFGSGTDGGNPYYGAVAADGSGDVFGTTYQYGANGRGNVWEVTAAGAYRDLHDFGGMVSSIHGTQVNDGEYPDDGGVALDSAGNLYGSTSYGGANSFGMIWEVTVFGNYVDLEDSTQVNNSGLEPISGITFDAAGNFYGLDNGGGDNYGVIWEISGINGLSVSPNPVLGAGTTTGTVTIPFAAPAGGWTVYLSSSNPNYIGVPATVVIPQGTTNTTFNVTTQDYGSAYRGVITADDGVVLQQALVTVDPIAISGLTVLPSPIVEGNTATGTVTLSTPAPAGGWTVYLSSSTSYAGVPASVVIGAGSTSATFNVTTADYSTNYTATIKATDNLKTLTAPLSVECTYLTGVSVSPNPISAGTTGTGTVTLSQAAPAGGWNVNLSSSTSYVGVPTSVTVPAGSTTTTFNVTPANYGANYTATIKATDSVKSVSTPLSVECTYLTSVSVSPNPILAGTTGTGTVTLSQIAPAGGWNVNLSSSTSYVGVPTSVTVPAGSTTTTFTVTAANYNNNYAATITAKDSVSSKSTSLAVNSIYIASVSLSPSQVANGTSSQGTVTLSEPAPAGGWTIQLVSAAPTYVSVPTSVFIAGGATQATFSVTSGLRSVMFTYLIGITASHSASTKTADLTLTP